MSDEKTEAVDQAFGDDYSLGAFEEKRYRKSRRVTGVFLAVALVALVALGGWQAWEALRPPQIESYADVPVMLVGLEEEPVTITAAEVAELPCQLVSASNASDRAGQGATVEKTAYGYGPTLQTLLAQYGYQLEDFRRIVIDCRDGYQTAIMPGADLDGEVYLSIAQGKNPLPEPMQPMRLIMPAMPPGQWVYCIETITFEPK